jgi:hypothetical protein
LNQRRAAGFRSLAALTLASAGLVACGVRPPEPAAIEPGLGVAEVARLIAPQIDDREGWATDVLAALDEIDRPATARAVCAALAVIEQESTFRANPEVPNLGSIIGQAMERRAREVGGLLGPAALRTLLAARAEGQRSTFDERFRRARTERDVDRLFRDLVAHYRRQHPTATILASGMSRLLAGKGLAALNPITTAGSMQVAVRFAAERLPASSEDEVRELLYTRAGGVRFGVARLLDYEVEYDRMLYRFADYNAGFYASRNAAFQEQLGGLVGRTLALDGDLLIYDDGQPVAAPSETLRAAAALAASRGWDLSLERIRREFLDEKRAEFERSEILRRVRQAHLAAGRELRTARLPDLLLESPKLSRGRTTAWFAEAVERRYRRCLGAAPAASAPTTARGGAV